MYKIDTDFRLTYSESFFNLPSPISTSMSFGEGSFPHPQLLRSYSHLQAQGFTHGGDSIPCELVCHAPCVLAGNLILVLGGQTLVRVPMTEPGRS